MASTYSTLENIIIKVRRLTRSLSEDLLSDDAIIEYINTFVLYDFPQSLRLFDLKTTLSFYTVPYVDEYSTVDTPNTDPLYDFKNSYISTHTPIYIAGYQAFYTQSRSQFFNINPALNNQESIGTGDAATTNFTYTLSQIPVLRKNVTISSLTAANVPLIAIDDPQTDRTGNLIPPDDDGTVYGTINYVTGAIDITWPTAPGTAEDIIAQTVPYQPGLPVSMLYYDGVFTLRPVPDKTYRVNIEVFKQPTALIALGSPELAQWWQYIAYGAAKKVFEDRQDLESVQQILPEFKMQENMVLSRTIMQQKEERTATIYTEQTGIGASGNWWGYGGPF